MMCKKFISQARKGGISVKIYITSLLYSLHILFESFDSREREREKLTATYSTYCITALPKATKPRELYLIWKELGE